MPLSIRLATPQDAAQIAEIYAPAVTDLPTSFEVEPPSPEIMAERIAKTLEQFPWYVCAEGDLVVGYAYAGRHRERAAYQWNAEVSVYIRPEYHRRGIGVALYEALLDTLRVQGYRNAIAGVTLPNAGSVGLHARMGFQSVGVYPNAGYKMGAWRDTYWSVLNLQDLPEPPTPPIPLPELSPDQTAISCAKGEALLHR